MKAQSRTAQSLSVPAGLAFGMLIITVSADPTAAGTLFSTDSNRNTFVAIDSETAVPTEFGPPGTLGLNSVSGLSFHPTTGVLYGVDAGTDRLVTIDTTTGVGTVAGTGPLGLGSLTSGQGAIDAAAFASDGTLYGWDPFPASLVTIDLTTGAATRVPDSPPSTLVFFGGMAFSPDGTLFGTTLGTRSLVTIDTITGALATVGAIHSGGVTIGAPVTGLAFAPDGTLFGILSAGSSALVRIDPQTAEATTVGSIGLAGNSLAHSPGEGIVPAPNSLTLALVWVSLLLIRRSSANRTRPRGGGLLLHGHDVHLDTATLIQANGGNGGDFQNVGGCRGAGRIEILHNTSGSLSNSGAVEVRSGTFGGDCTDGEPVVTASPSVGIPEPSTAALVLVGCAALARRPARRRIRPLVGRRSRNDVSRSCSLAAGANPTTRGLIAAVALTSALATRSADANNGEGFFSVSMSTATESLDVAAVDPITLLPLASTFTANDLGAYELSGLIILDGDTANPIGDFEITGQGDPHLKGRVNILAPPSYFHETFGTEILFLQLLSGIDITPVSPSLDVPALIQSVQTTTTTGSPGIPPCSCHGFVSNFLETADGKSTNAVDVGVGGALLVPGTTMFDSGMVEVPELPPETMEEAFSVLVVQHDFAFFDISEDTSFTLESTARTEIFLEPPGIPGDYNNDGTVDAADYVLWRKNPAAFGGDPAGFNTWVANFGGTGGSGSLSSASAPEPATALLLCIAAVSWLAIRRKRVVLL